MGGFFGVASKKNCTLELFYGVDYHSHLGTRRGGMAMHGETGFQRAIHNIENSPFRTKFEKDVEELQGNLGIGCISDYEPQPLMVQSHLGSFAITTVGKINNQEELLKEVFEHEGINIVDWFYILPSGYGLEETKKKAKKIGYPLIIKPANLGSSVGIEVIHSEDELEEKIKECSKYDFKLVIEKMVTDMKEVNISVMGSIFEQKVSAIEEVYKEGEFLDFTNKYEKGSKGTKGAKGAKCQGSKGMASTSRKVPADISDVQKGKVESMAVKAFKALNAKGAVRIDFIIDNKTEEVYVNEINTIPGSLAFYLWSEVGMDFSKECDELIQNALRMYREKQKKTYSFDTNILSNFKKR